MFSSLEVLLVCVCDTRTSTSIFCSAAGSPSHGGQPDGHGSLRVFLTTLSRSLTSTCSPPLLASSVTGTSPLGLSRCVLQCCSIPVHLQCIADLVHESVICPVCNAQSPSSLDFLHFQHLCNIHQVEAPVGDCMICSGFQTMASLPCCRQSIHYECLARSVHSCGDRCPFCTQDLVPVLSDLF